MNSSSEIVTAPIAHAGDATILLVDDDAGNRRMFGWLLREAGYRIQEAATGQEALQLARSGPDVVILDVNLPDISGFEVCRQLRLMPETMHAGVLHLSAVFVGSSDRTQGLDGGADAYLIKPVEPRELLAHVRALLRAKAAEDAFRRAAKEWRSTFDAIHDAVCLLDLRGHISRCNQALCDWLGRDFGHLLGRPLDACLRDGLKLAHEPAVARLGQGSSRTTSEMVLAERWVQVTADPRRDDQGNLIGSVLILTDVTRRKQLEEQLRQSQRLEAIGRLAGGVAHDFNNLLTSIVGNALLLSSKMSREEAGHDLVKTIERAAWRGAELTRQLLGFARQTLLWLQVVDPGPILAEAREQLLHLLPAGVALRVEVAADLWPVQADPAQLLRVLDQLGRNAIESLEGQGSLLFQAANVEVTAEHAARHLDARVGSHVRLSVHDDGPVIGAELLASIFDPFAGGELVGRASGLGLAMVHGIVKQHQGWAECVSSRETGTAFHLYLPRAGEGLAGGQATPATVAFPTGEHRLLLIDADDTLRNLAATYLRRAGVETLLAPDGPSALDIFRADYSRIDLVIQAQAMPWMGDADISGELRQIDPAVPILLAGEPTGGTDVIARPYQERDLLQAVFRAMRRSHDG